MTQHTPQQADLVDLVKKLSPQDGDILQLPAASNRELGEQLAEAIQIANPGVKCMVICGDLRRLTVSDMNDAGWYRA
ncbi:hypothetical protein [Pseudomonas denitrificans (nom. rej.)]|jgi:transcription termination factor Rho|uniref:Uncharacterized protein n=1 Tax=Pseudomonas denitrificans TaxID=43306 RepID=A0A9X7R621_PSEDE|nr:hypothetical protein [Pseudomonas denitrificans (nom. rej.)]QEY74093.1 hypothetical protein F1C79_22165 [Pseudomonas denitrificans (nom. rej.)]